MSFRVCAVDQSDVELGLNTAIVLELSEEAGFIRGDGTEGCFEDIEDLSFWEVDGDVLQGLLLLGDGRSWLSLFFSGQ